MVSARATMFIALGIGNASSASAGMQPVQMRCEFKVDPLCIDAINPGLSWKGRS